MTTALVVVREDADDVATALDLLPCSPGRLYLRGWCLPGELTGSFRTCEVLVAINCGNNKYQRNELLHTALVFFIDVVAHHAMLGVSLGIVR